MGYKKNGSDFGAVFEPRGTSPKRANVGYIHNGSDISNQYYSLTEGGSSPGNTNYRSNGTDLGNLFAEIDSVNTPVAFIGFEDYVDFTESNTSGNILIPTGTVVGDLGILITYNSENNPGITEAESLPYGWTQIQFITDGNVLAGNYYKVFDALDMSNGYITFPQSPYDTQKTMLLTFRWAAGFTTFIPSLVAYEGTNGNGSVTLDVYGGAGQPAYPAIAIGIHGQRNTQTMLGETITPTPDYTCINTADYTEGQKIYVYLFDDNNPTTAPIVLNMEDNGSQIQQGFVLEGVS